MQATTEITAEQMNDLMPYVEAYQQEKRDAAAQHEAELKAAETCANYETTTERKARKSVKKEVTIIARYQFKADPKKVVYLVRASNGKDTYQVFFYNGKACSCDCPARKPCKHMTQLELREQARGWAIPEGKSLVRDGYRPEEFPVGMSVPTFHGDGVIVEPVAKNFENIEFVTVEVNGEREGISCADLRGLLREQAIDEDAKIERWTALELAALGKGPVPAGKAPTPRKVSMAWLCSRH